MRPPSCASVASGLGSAHPSRSSPPSGCASCTAARSTITSMTDAGTLIASLAMAVAAGMIGCFAVMRRMALASDAISHVALPGIGVALALGIHPLLGAAAMLMFGALAIWALERRARIATETIIGVVFSAALAAGSLLSSGENLVDALFGGRGAIGAGERGVGIAAALAVVGFGWRGAPPR